MHERPRLARRRELHSRSTRMRPVGRKGCENLLSRKDDELLQVDKMGTAS